jgi:glycosyltransferase involved in cell wall biosynthesis
MNKFTNTSPPLYTQQHKPAVSVIVPVYNVESYLGRCLDSIVAQTFSDIEIVLVDDASPDNSPKICDEYALKDTRFKVIHKTKNEGLPQARKSGLEIADGDFVLYVDSDDWIEHDMVEKLYAKAIADNLDVVVCDMYESALNEKYLKYNFVTENKVIIAKQLLMYQFYNSLCNKLIKKSIYQLVEFPVDGQSEDMIITAQTLYYADNIGFVPNKMYHVFYNLQSLTRNPTRRQKRDDERFRNFILLINILKKQFPDTLVLEPEYSSAINARKIAYIFPRESRDINKFHQLSQVYPISNKQIFSKKCLNMPFRKRIILFLAANNFIFLVKTLDFLVPIYRVFKRCFYAK